MDPAEYSYEISGSAHRVRIYFCPDVYTTHALERITALANQRSPLGMDIETTGLEPGNQNFQIRSIQVATAYESWVIPNDASGNNVDLIYDALLRGRCPIVTQNGVFDWTALMVTHGVADIDPERLRDTRIMAHHWDQRGKGDGKGAVGHSLEALIRRYHNERVADEVKSAPTKIAKRLKISKQEYFTTVPLDDAEFVTYAGMDPVETVIIQGILALKLSGSPVHSAELLRRDHEDMYNCILMGAAGMRVDRQYFTDLGKLYTEQYEEAVARAAELGVTALGSGVQLAAKFKEEGYPPLKKTKPSDRFPEGQFKVDAVELRRQAERGSELAQVVLDGKHAQKWNNTFVKGILNASSKNGRMHPQFNPLGARTGRYSSSGPNMQNLPGKVNDIRNGIVVDDPATETGVSLDYQSQELRLLAALSQDPQLVLDIVEGRKPPKLLAARIYGEGYSDDQYVRTKNTLYGMIYGGGAKTLSEQAGIPIEETRAVMKSFFDMYPVTKQYSKRLASMVAQQGYVQNIAGRLIVVDADRGYTALNYLMQSTGRELIAGAVRAIMKSRWKSCLRLVVHDEIVTVTPTAGVDLMISEVSAMMDTEVNGMHFPVEAEVWGERWKGHYE